MVLWKYVQCLMLYKIIAKLDVQISWLPYFHTYHH